MRDEVIEKWVCKEKVEEGRSIAVGIQEKVTMKWRKENFDRVIMFPDIVRIF